MVKQSYAYGLPLLNENPFSIRPLEPGELGKMVGRDEVFNRLKNYLRLGSARRIMLTGPLGSGRTSLVRCLKPYAGAYASIEHLPAINPAKALLDMIYKQLLGAEAPSGRVELVNQLVAEMYGFSNKLPMIVIDVPASDLSILKVALRDAQSSIERLKAVVILVCDARERHQLPQGVVDTYERLTLHPFTPSDVIALVKQRLASLGVNESDFTHQDATELLEVGDGFPAAIITTLRNAVDSLRMDEGIGLKQPEVDTSAKLLPRDGPSTLGQIMTPRVEEVVESAPSIAFDDPLPVNTDDETTETPLAYNSDIIDASLPWMERDEPVEDDVNAFGDLFDLDMNELAEAQELDEPLQPTPFTTPIIDASAPEYGGGSSIPAGPFGRLAQRNKVHRKKITEEKNDPDFEENVQHSVVSEKGNEYWVAIETPELPDDTLEDLNGAELIHDEIGLIEETEFIPEPMYEPEAFETQPLNVQPSEVFHKQTPSQNDLVQLLAEIVANLGQSEGVSGTKLDSSIMKFFESKQKVQLGSKEAYPLNKNQLNSLNMRDAYVVSMADQRSYSPSDEEMLEHLGIKRARLSQISNRLLKHGILQVRQVGRSRNYQLTQSARAQLIAWGGISGGEA
ncbi:MAG: hypothetical protein DWC01_07115 [Candidatus Poseidoniales archaeon]|nr:MAG: hypothetical protein DWC01_07115 [Candidatus Poseidoniales archaeon]